MYRIILPCINSWGQDIVSEDEIKEGVCQPVDLLHAHAGAAGVAANKTIIFLNVYHHSVSDFVNVPDVPENYPPILKLKLACLQ